MIFDPAFKQVQHLFRPRCFFVCTWMPGMVGSSTGVCEFDSVVRGHFVYKTVCIPAIDETLQVVQEETNNQSTTMSTLSPSLKKSILLGMYLGGYLEYFNFLDMAPLHVESPATERKKLGWRYHVFI